MPTIERPKLHVEGINDAHVVHQLLVRHQLDWPLHKDKRPNSDFDPTAPEIRQVGNKEAVLNAMELVTLSSDRPVGFVLDADLVPQNRWQMVCGKLRGVGLELPDEIPKEGFVANSRDYRTRVGVWLMPDNHRDGALETFLEDLAENSDQLLSIAESSTTDALTNGAKFPTTKHRKAVLHTWLAWQKEPGMRYGEAIKAKFFHVNSPTAQAFVSWCKRVFLCGE